MLTEERDLKVPPPAEPPGCGSSSLLRLTTRRAVDQNKHTHTVRYGVCSCLLGFIISTDHREPLLKQSAVGRDVVVGSGEVKLRTDRSAFRRRDERLHRGHRSGALPLRTLLRHLRTGHWDRAGGGRVSRYDDHYYTSVLWVSCVVVSLDSGHRVGEQHDVVEKIGPGWTGPITGSEQHLAPHSGPVRSLNTLTNLRYFQTNTLCCFFCTMNGAGVERRCACVCVCVGGGGRERDSKSIVILSPFLLMKPKYPLNTSVDWSLLQSVFYQTAVMSTFIAPLVLIVNTCVCGRLWAKVQQLFVLRSCSRS